MKQQLELRKENNHLILNCANKNCDLYNTDTCPLSALERLEFSDDCAYCLVATTETVVEEETAEEEEIVEIEKVVRPIQLNQSKFLKSFRRSVRQ